MNVRKNFKCEFCSERFATTDKRKSHEAARHPDGAIWHGGDCTSRRAALRTEWGRYVAQCDMHPASMFWFNEKRVARAITCDDFCPDCKGLTQSQTPTTI